MERERILAFRVARQGLAERATGGLAAGAVCPASDFTPGAALLALAARVEGVTREVYERATDAGELVVAFTLRAALHAVAPGDWAAYGRGLLAVDDDELGRQLGPQARQLIREAGISAGTALEEVAEATRRALAGGRALGKDELHEQLRQRVRPELMPWCKGCGSHHVAPMLWRYAAVRAGSRCDSERRHLLGEPGPVPETGSAEAARRFLGFYGPSTAADFAAWTGIAPGPAKRAFAGLVEELVEVRREGKRAWLLSRDLDAAEGPAPALGVRLLPPRDPYLQQPDRETLAPDPDLRKRLFRPVANPGGVLQDGCLVGLWRMRTRGRATEFEVEELGGRCDRAAVEAEAETIAALRGRGQASVSWA